jgi:hypothetical protein
MELHVADFASLFTIDIFSKGIAFENGYDFPTTFAMQLNHALDQIYEIFQRNRSQLLSTVGSTLENIRKTAMEQFDTGWHQFQRFREGVKVNHAIACDLLAVNHALKMSPDWYKAFIGEGLEFIASGDIHYHTGDKVGEFHRFRKPAL